MSYWQGKKLVWNGDSISYGSQLKDIRTAFPLLVAERLGMTVANYAIGGATVAKKPDAYECAFADFKQWEAAMAEGRLDQKATYMVKDNFFAPRPWRLYHYEDGQWVPGGTDNVDVARTPLVDRIEEMDPDADVIGIMIGTNDFYYNWTAFGEMADGYYSRDAEHTVANPTTTFYGAMHTMMRKLLARYPGKDIFLVTPIKRVQQDGVGRGTWDYYYPEQKNGLGLTMNDYRRAIQEIAEYYSVPCIDLYAVSGFNPHIDPSLFGDKDEKVVHPNEEGHERMASIITAFMKAYRC